VHDLLRILAVFALVFANAFFVIAEYSIVTARRGPLQQRDTRGARIALKLMDDPVRVISTVQVGITAVAILTGAVGEPVVRDLLGDGVPHWVGFAIAFAVVTYLSVVIGELAPKALVLDRAEPLAARVARLVDWMARVLAPVVWVLDRSANVLLKPFGVEDVRAGEGVRSAEELRAIVDEAEGAGVIPRAQEELLHNVFDFAGREVRDIMIPALDVAWLEASLSVEEGLKAAMEQPHERYPVGDGSLDNPVGILHIHVLLAAESGTLRDLARPAPIVPETKDIGALLRELRDQRQQLAIVADEYGATAGIVAIEDILEEIVGEIESEYAVPDDELSWVDDRTVEAPGSMTIDDFNESVGASLPQRGPRTLAGLAFDALGRRPRPGDAVSVDGVRLEVEQVDGVRITKLRIALS
jgi:putative hemolysin